MMPVTQIDIGGGTKPAFNYENLDPVHGEGVWKRRIQDGIPAEDETIRRVRASHVLEHIPAGKERIDLFNEVWRVLVPGGEFEIIVPLMLGTWHAIADPTHVSLWVPESFQYFTGEIEADANYGIRLWQRPAICKVFDGWEGHCALLKPY